jgi:hypothetical protein
MSWIHRIQSSSSMGVKYLRRGRNTMDLRGQEQGLTSLDLGEAKAVSTVPALGHLRWNLVGSWLLDLPHLKSSPTTGTVWDAEGEAMREDRERGKQGGLPHRIPRTQQRRPRLCCAVLRCRLPRERERGEKLGRWRKFRAGCASVRAILFAPFL